MKKNKVRRYRLAPQTAQRLGCEINRGNRYRLTKEQEKKLFELDQHKIKRLFFDIETTPMVVYSWRIGYKLNIPYENIIEDWKIICISYKWQGSEKVHTLTWENNCDKSMLEKFISIANTADELVAHNGDRFDIKKIRTRCIYHRIPMFPNYRTLDTLKKSRGGFSFDSNRLDYIAKYLGVGAKVEHEGFNMWVECLKGNKDALKRMVEYCEGDIIVLEDVFTVLQNYVKHNTHTGVVNGDFKYTCPNCGSNEISLLKNNITPTGTIKRLMECKPCGYNYEISNSAYSLMMKFR